MAMTQPFTTVSPIIASFDFIDFGTGSGYKKFYAAGAANASTNLYFLTPENVSSDLNVRWINASGEVNFDITFLRPMTIQGRIYIKSTQSGVGGTISTVFTIKKNTTSLGTETTQTVGSGHVEVKLCYIDVAKTDFEIGDVLRLVVNPTIGGTSSIQIDPSGRQAMTEYLTSATVTGDLYILVPFLVQV